MAVPFMSMLVLVGFFAPLQTVLGPIHWCVYGRFQLCLTGDYYWLSSLLSHTLLGLVSAAYIWLQWLLIWKK